MSSKNKFPKPATPILLILLPWRYMKANGEGTQLAAQNLRNRGYVISLGGMNSAQPIHYAIQLPALTLTL